MVADELALDLARKHVGPGTRVLDPFCGSGRLLAASEFAAQRVGVDANPLAWLITAAKLGSPDCAVLEQLLAGLNQAELGSMTQRLDLAPGRRVEWFSVEAAERLSLLIGWLNTQALEGDTLLVVGSIVSATARECSFARSGWKLHRLSAENRKNPRPDPMAVFGRRLRGCLKDLRLRQPLAGNSMVLLGDTRHADLKGGLRFKDGFDVVLTSPPYGDSRTTVQYGAASELCLGVVTKLVGLEHLFSRGSEIDSASEGSNSRTSPSWDVRETKAYWGGGADNRAGQSVRRFLGAYAEICGSIGDVVAAGGKAIFIVGRRSTGGFRLRLDDFTVDRFLALGFVLEERFERILKKKKSPLRINRFARSEQPALRDRGAVPTFDRDIVLVLRKVARTTVERVAIAPPICHTR